MEVCPVGFFCFDKNTLMLVIVSLVLVVVFYISKNNDKFNDIKNKLDENKNNLENKIMSLKHQNSNLETKLTVHNQIADEANYLANKDMNRVINPLVPPQRSYPYKINRVGVPVNVPTRGYATGYQQVGVLIEQGANGEKKCYHYLVSKLGLDQDNGNITLQVMVFNQLNYPFKIKIVIVKIDTGAMKYMMVIM